MEIKPKVAIAIIIAAATVLHESLKDDD